jgi:phosphoglycolate phosphatase
MWKNIILDWSGTVVDDLRFVWEATNHVLTHFGRSSMTLDRFRAEFRLPWIQYYEVHLSGVDREAINRVFWLKMEETQGAIDLLPRARDFLLYCREHHLPVFVLSTVDEKSFQGQADRLGASPMICKAYVGVEDKRMEIQRLMEENRLDPAETVMVGDMIHDIETARSAGIAACSVLTGFDPQAKLAAAKPDLIVQDLSGLQAVLEAQQMHPARFPVTDGDAGHG